jgi:hypothetical protein
MIDEQDEQPQTRPLDGGKAVLAAILAGATGGTQAGMTSGDSRHATVGTATVELPVDTDGTTQTFVYLRRRFLPDPAQFATLRLYTAQEGERLDQIAAKELNDPLAFWKLCDANRIMSPLRWPGRSGTRLRVPLPGGAAPERRW